MFVRPGLRAATPRWREHGRQPLRNCYMCPYTVCPELRVAPLRNCDKFRTPLRVKGNCSETARTHASMHRATKICTHVEGNETYTTTPTLQEQLHVCPGVQAVAHRWREQKNLPNLRTYLPGSTTISCSTPLTNTTRDGGAPSER